MDLLFNRVFDETWLQKWLINPINRDYIKGK